MTTPWAHLPNAAHIDAVLADVKARPEVWDAAWGAAWDTAWDAAWDAARRAARDAVWEAVWEAAKGAVRRAAWNAAWDAARDAARDAVWGTLLALVAWDSSAALLDQPPDVLSAMIDLADAPVCHQAVLLLPYAIVRFGT